MRVLVIEDDPTVTDYVVTGLQKAGHVVGHAADGERGLLLASTESYDVMVIDRMLPEMDGLAIVEKIRGASNTTPVLILSALGEVVDRVHGLKSGGDDYLTKPFAFPELMARIEALVRRSSSTEAKTRLEVDGLEMDLLKREVWREGERIELKPREFQLLEYLMRNANQIVTRTMLLEAVWDYHFDPQTNVIDVHISKLRQKVDRKFDKPLIQTVRGVGYVLRTVA